jgi:hypothetical protein
MQRATVVDIQENENPEDVCFNNLKVSDEFRNLAYFISSSMGWLNLNPGKNYQDLEKVLREKNFDTHLIATNKTQDVKLQMPDKTDAEYVCTFSCRPKNDALKELLQHSKSYEENLEKLSKAGSYVVDDKKDLENPNVVKLTDPQVELHKMISENKKKIKMEKVGVEKFLTETIEMCEKECGKTPEEKIVGMMPNGGPIFGLFVGDQLVTQYGFTIDYNEKKEELMKMVDLRTLF